MELEMATIFMTGLFAFLFYAATVILALGLTRKIVQYSRAPSPLTIPVTPAPVTRTGQVLRTLREVILFESLLGADGWAWTFGWLFHAGLVLVLIWHLRFFTGPDWDWDLLYPMGYYGGLMMAVGLAGLWARRLFIDRMRYISKPSDHLMLALLAGIAGSGLFVANVAYTDSYAVKLFFLGLMRADLLHLQALPGGAALYLHLLLVVVLMAVFPFSKLLHAPGVFFSPTRSQLDNPRERRRLAPWAARLRAPGDR
jgi:nitrate reductase gamma subunit